MIAMVHVYPPWAWVFMADGRMPDLNHRCVPEENPLDEFTVVEELSSRLEPVGRVNVLMRGPSFDRLTLNKIPPGPKYLINWPEKVEGSDVYYATADQNDLMGFRRRGLSPVFYVQVATEMPDGKMHITPLRPEIKEILEQPGNKHIAVHLKSNMSMPALGSGLACIAALGATAESMHIYGWDHYLSVPPKTLNYFQSLKSLFQPLEFSNPCATISCAIFNFHYAMRLTKVKHVWNYGLTGQLAQCQALASKLNRIFYNAPFIELPSNKQNSKSPGTVVESSGRIGVR